MPRVAGKTKTKTKPGRRRIYGELRSGIEDRGGKMEFDRGGSAHGTWVVRLGDRVGYFESLGTGFPDLDRLYVAKIQNPTHWKHYTNKLKPEAIEELISKLK